MNDETKDSVLGFLLEMQQKSPGRHVGYPKLVIVRGLTNKQGRETFGSLTVSGVGLAIDYLEDKGFLKTDTRDGVKFYRLSDKAQDKLLGPSAYSGAGHQNIRVTNNNGVMILGGTNYGAISIDMRQQVLGGLEDIIREAKADQTLTEEDKASLIQNVLTLEAQVKAPEPDKTIVRHAWGTIEKAAALSGAIQLGQLVAQVAPHITSILQ